MSEVIATMLLVAITVAGGVMVATVFQSSDALDISTRVSTVTADTSSSYIKLIGFDTRDGASLSGINGLDNFIVGGVILCTTSCSTNADDLPTLGLAGTEFIILKIRNVGLDLVYVKNILVFGVNHTWDPNTANSDLDVTNNLSGGGSYPQAGMFSILPQDNLDGPPFTQSSSNLLNANREMRILVKLSDQIIPDITAVNPLQIMIDTDRFDSTIFVPSGGMQ